MRSRLLLLAAVPLLASGCATVFARGIVKDAAGEPLGNAAIKITSAQTGQLLAFGVTDGGGCFHLAVPAPKGETRFSLDASLPGFKPVEIAIGVDRPILVTQLAAVLSGQPSRMRRMSYQESYDVWELTCQPPSPIGN